MHGVAENYMIILYLFIFFCLCICVYNIKEALTRYYDRKTRPKKLRAERQFIEASMKRIEAGGLPDRIRRTGFRSKDLLLFHAALCEEKDANPRNEDLRAFSVRRIDQYIQLCERKNPIVKNYLVFLIGHHQAYSSLAAKFLVDCLVENSITIKMEVLRSMAKLGNSDLLIRGLEVLDERNIKMNDKMITDTLSDFEGLHEELDPKLLAFMEHCGDYMKLAIITYFYANDMGLVRDKLVQLLEDGREDKEVTLRIIKYFGTIYDERAEEQLISYALSDVWEYAAVAAKTLRNYPSAQTIAAAKKRLNDSNWYIRLNNAETLARLCGRDQLEDVLASDDRYAREIMAYALERKETLGEKVR